MRGDKSTRPPPHSVRRFIPPSRAYIQIVQLYYMYSICYFIYYISRIDLKRRNIPPCFTAYIFGEMCIFVERLESCAILLVYPAILACIHALLQAQRAIRLLYYSVRYKEKNQVVHTSRGLPFGIGFSDFFQGSELHCQNVCF